MENDVQKNEFQKFPIKDEFFQNFFPIEKAFSIVPGSSESASLGKSFYLTAKLYYDKADLLIAQDYFERALECGMRPEDNFTLLKVLGFLIRISSELLETEKVNHYIALARDMIFELEKNLTHLSSEYFYNAGVIENYNGNFEEAKKHYLMAEKLAKEENNFDLLSKNQLALAMNAFNRSEFEEGYKIICSLDELLQSTRKVYLYGTMLFFKGHVCIELNKLQEAVKCFKMANMTLQKKKSWNLYAYILLGKGVVYKKMGQFQKSLNFLNLALESLDNELYKRLTRLIDSEIHDVNDSSVDLYLDRTNRMLKEKSLGEIDFKHRFVLLEILFLLAKNPGVYFDKEKLAKLIWANEYNPLIHDKLIYTSVSRLRKLIEPKKFHGEKRKYIIRGKEGYAFCPEAKIRFHMEPKVTVDKAIANVEICSPV